MHDVAGRDPGSRAKVFFIRFFTFCKLSSIFKLFTKQRRRWDYVVLTIFIHHVHSRFSRNNMILPVFTILQKV